MKVVIHPASLRGALQVELLVATLPIEEEKRHRLAEKLEDAVVESQRVHSHVYLDLCFKVLKQVHGYGFLDVLDWVVEVVVVDEVGRQLDARPLVVEPGGDLLFIEARLSIFCLRAWHNLDIDMRLILTAQAAPQIRLTLGLLCEAVQVIQVLQHFFLR